MATWIAAAAVAVFSIHIYRKTATPIMPTIRRHVWPHEVAVVDSDSWQASPCLRSYSARASPDICEHLEAEGMLYAIRTEANRAPQEHVAHLRTCRVGRPPNHVRRCYPSFSHQAGSWNRKHDVMAKVE
jgi:hypothetical protein